MLCDSMGQSKASLTDAFTGAPDSLVKLTPRCSALLAEANAQHDLGIRPAKCSGQKVRMQPATCTFYQHDARVDLLWSSC